MGGRDKEVWEMRGEGRERDKEEEKGLEPLSMNRSTSREERKRSLQKSSSEKM